MRELDERRNKPTPEGRTLGRQIARLTEIAIKDARNVHRDLPERCRSCAFREGTFPNGCPETLLDAIDCLRGSAQFMCHHHKKGEPMHVCAGYLACKLSMKLQDAMSKVPLPEPGIVPWKELAKQQGKL